jgi:hypothetical protein
MNYKNKKIVFISSYPKSGNTWLRSIIGAIYNKNNGIFSSEDFKKTPDFSQIKNFKNFKNIKYQKNGNINFNWLSKKWVPLQKIFNEESQNIIYFKTHSLQKIQDVEFTSKDTCLGFIYIYRDPRDVAISYMHHAKGDLDTAIKVMLYKKDNYTDFQSTNEWVSTWKNHYSSWKSFGAVPSLFIKYERMIEQPLLILNQILEYINSLNVDKVTLTKKKKENIIKSTSFKSLLENEIKTEGKKETYFYRKGTAAQWKDVLSQNQLNLIETELKNQMIQLDYLN